MSFHGTNFRGTRNLKDKQSMRPPENVEKIEQQEDTGKPESSKILPEVANAYKLPPLDSESSKGKDFV